MQREMNFGCSEEFAELCALATSASLSSADEERLEAHVALCADCALLLNQYRTIASSGMARLAAAREPGPTESLPDAGDLKRKLFAALVPLQVPSSAANTEGHSRLLARLAMVPRFPAAAAVAALVLLALGTGYFVGSSHRSGQVRPVLAVFASTQKTLSRQLDDAQADLKSAKEALSAATMIVSGLQGQLDGAQKNRKDLLDAKISLEARLDAALAESQQRSSTLVALTAERDTLSQKLRESDSQLQLVRQQLRAAQDEQQYVVLRTASLETQITNLTKQLTEREDVLHRHEQYLASDRDVRELMGARQLYIADVFDVDPQGRTRKPFGRVFYTKGKSLIFYAFDLDQQDGYKEAKAFQAWGKPGAGNAEPISLGIFYLDNERNRRWALKFENPKVLEEIDSLFVTVEPQGGSRRPTNKPFLVAYLHSTEPNHP